MSSLSSTYIFSTYSNSYYDRLHVWITILCDFDLCLITSRICNLFSLFHKHELKHSWLSRFDFCLILISLWFWFMNRWILYHFLFKIIQIKITRRKRIHARVPQLNNKSERYKSYIKLFNLLTSTVLFLVSPGQIKVHRFFFICCTVRLYPK